MRKALTIALVVLLSAAPSRLFAKGQTTKIVIEGPDLSKPIVMTDRKILANFDVWAGPGTSTNEPDGFIIHWSQGATAEPSKELPRYQASFYTDDQKGPSYVVYYRYDPSTKSGYVYLPGRADKWYWVNMGSIARGIEGNWFHARASWDSAAEPLILRGENQ